MCEPRNFYDIYQIHVLNECFNVTHIDYLRTDIVLKISEILGGSSLHTYFLYVVNYRNYLSIH